MPPNQHELEAAPLLDDNNNTIVVCTGIQRVKTVDGSPLEAALNSTKYYGSMGQQWQKTDGRYDPLQHRKLDNPTTNLDTLMHILNGNLGTGILAMPDAFKNSGLYVGLFGTMIMGAICTHCMHILVGCARELCSRNQMPSMSFAEVGQYSLESVGLRRLGRFIAIMINSFLVLMQIGFCSVYFLFVAVNIRDFLEYVSIELETFTVLVCLLVPMIALNMIRSLKLLTPTSLIASVLAISGITISFVFLLQDLPRTTSVSAASSWGTLPLYFGTAMYAIEGIGVLLPLESNMKTPRDFCRWNGVLNTGMAIVVCLYTAIGFYGYLKYGDAAQGSITLNLPSEVLLGQLVRLLMAVAVFASYALQFFVPMSILGPSIRRPFGTSNAQDLAEYTLRIALVLLTFTLAAVIPNLGAFISLVGAVSTSTLALVFPPLLDIVTRWPEKRFGAGDWIFWKDIAIACFGMSGFLIGTSTSVNQIVVNWE